MGMPVDTQHMQCHWKGFQDLNTTTTAAATTTTNIVIKIL